MDERDEKQKDSSKSLHFQLVLGKDNDDDDDDNDDDDDDDDDGYGGDDSKYQRQTLGNNYLTVINSTPSIIGRDDDTLIFFCYFSYIFF